jgi:hypothetical protein
MQELEGKRFRVGELYSLTAMISALDGEGEGFGNRISIQTVAIVRAARALRRVHSVDEGRPVSASQRTNSSHRRTP